MPVDPRTALTASAFRPGCDPSRTPKRLLPTGVLVVQLALILAPLATAEEPATADTAEASSVGTTVNEPTAGWRVYRDPETGRLLSEPLPGQAESLAAKFARRRADGLPATPPRTFPVVLRGRTVGIGAALEDRFVTATVARTLPDGTQVLACLDHGHVHSAPPPAAPPER